MSVGEASAISNNILALASGTKTALTPQLPGVDTEPVDRTARLELFDGDALIQRFSRPNWKRDRAAVDAVQLVTQARAAATAGCRELVISAGEPSAHPNFDDILNAAISTDAAVTIECEGGWLDEATLAHLADSGVSRLRIVSGGIRERVYEHVMRAQDAWRAGANGTALALASDIPVDVVVPVIAWNKDDVVPLLEWLRALPGNLAGFFLQIPRVSGVGAGLREVLVPHSEIAGVAAEAFATCRRWRINYGFADSDAVYPCAAGGVLDAYGSVFHQSIRRQRREPDRAMARVAACTDCSLRQTCRGVDSDYLAQFGEVELAPVPLSASTSWTLRPIGGAHEVDYKQISPFENDTPGNGRSLLRINGHCQMACAFCFVDRTEPDMDADYLSTELDKLAVRHTDHMVFSGGEPTIHPRLPELIAHAGSLDYSTVEIQTNGVKCADRDYAAALVKAGLNKATVSLHSMTPAVSDEITRMPNAFGKTIAGLHNLRDLGVETQLAHVITKTNYAALGEFVRAIIDEFPPRDTHLSICFAIAQGISDLVYSWVIPTFTEIRPHMREALDLCKQHGIGFGGLIGQGGYPPCMLDGEMSYYDDVLDKVYRSPDFDKQFHKAPGCDSCDFNTYCIGVRQDYVACYGDEEIRPITIAPELLSLAKPLPKTA